MGKQEEKREFMPISVSKIPIEHYDAVSNKYGIAKFIRNAFEEEFNKQQKGKDS